MKLILCTPMYGGAISSAFMFSCMELQRVCHTLNINFHYLFLINESLITRGRNKLCKSFLDIQDGTHLLFIDADIEFNPYDIIRLLQADKDIIGCPYALKSIDWNKVSEKAKGGEYDPNKLSMSGIRGVYNLYEERVEGSIKEVYEIGTGIMLIKRQVLEKIIEKNPEDYILTDGPGDVDLPIEQRKYYRFFDTETVDHRYLSEDYMFCKRWRELGGKIHLLIDAETKHWGSYGFIHKL